MIAMGIHSRIIHFGGFILVLLLILSTSLSQGEINNQIIVDEDIPIQFQNEEENTVDQITGHGFTNPNFKSKFNRSKDNFPEKSSIPMDFAIKNKYIANTTLDIKSNDDFETLGFPGSGIIADPYIIEGYTISGYGSKIPINIRDTTSYFVIRNNYLSSVGDGISLIHSSNGLIYNNTLRDSEGIYLESSNNNTITSNTISDCDYGFYSVFSDNNNITSNTFTNCVYGIYLRYSSFNIISSNVISNNTSTGIQFFSTSNSTITLNAISNSGHGIHFFSSCSNNTILSNIISNHTITGFQLGSLFGSGDNIIENNVFENSGLEFVFGSRQTKVENNTVNGYPLIFLQDVNNYVITGDVGQIILMNCTYIEIENKKISHTSSGIQLYFSSFSTIAYNTITNSSFDGIYLFYSSNNNISSNIISNNTEMGIRSGASSNNTFSSNIITNNFGDGLTLERILVFDNVFTAPSYNNTITSNFIANNTGAGIILYDKATNNTITSNIIANNIGAGIYLEFSSNNNTIMSNTISNNLNRGIYFSVSGYNVVIFNNITNNLNYGIYLRYIGSDNNIIKYNNFIDNGISLSSQVYDQVNPDNFKFNYWSDQTSPDIDNNELVDDPYVIDGSAGNFDNYPLTIPVGEGLHSPYIDNPSDIIYYVESDGNKIVWDIFNINPGEYYVSLDGEMYIEFTSWFWGEIKVDIDGLAIGSYTFIVYVFNTDGNQRSDTVIVTVTEVLTSSTSTIPSNTGSTDITNPGNTDSTTSLTQSPFPFVLLFPALIIQYFRKKSKVNRTIRLKVA